MLETIEDTDVPENEPIEATEDGAVGEASSYAEDEPPAADVLGIDVDGLPPRRARLARFLEWITRTRAELDELEEGRARFLEALGVPAVTRQKITELIESDATGLINWMRSGAMGITPRQVRSFERQQLEAKLKDDQHKAEVAKAALGGIEREILQKQRQIEELDARRRDFVYGALIEEAEALGQAYLNQIERLRIALTPLAALGDVVGQHGGYRAPVVSAEMDVRLPGFGLAALAHTGARHGATFKIDAGSIRDMTRQWRALAEAWAKDPHMPGLVDEHGTFRIATAANAATSIKSTTIDEPSALDQIPARLHGVIEELAMRCASLDWADRASDIAYTIERLRADEGADLAEGDIPVIVAALLEAWGGDAIESAPQAILASFSAVARHQELAEAWFTDHPEDKPASADIVTTLQGDG